MMKVGYCDAIILLAFTAALVSCKGHHPEHAIARNDVGADTASAEAGTGSGTCSGTADDRDDSVGGICAAANTVRWVRQPSGRGYRMSSGVAALADGSVVATGAFTGEVTFGAGEAGETTLITSGNSDLDIFVAKYLPNGDLAWAKRAGGTGPDNGNQTVGLPDGSVIITATSDSGDGSSVVFGPGEPGAVRLPLSGRSSVMVVKHEPGGALAWVKHITGTGTRKSGGIAAFPDGSFAVTGCFSLTSTFGPGESGETSLVAAGPTVEMYGGPSDPSDAFVAKYESNGTLAWVRRASALSAGACGGGIAALPDGGMAVTGRFAGGITFGKGDTRQTTLSTAGAIDTFVASYDASGALIWAKSAGDTRTQLGTGITVSSDGDLLVSGYQASVPAGVTDPGRSFLVARYDSHGVPRWGARAVVTRPSEARGIAALTDGSAVVTGTYSKNTTFGGGEPNEVTLTASDRGDPDIFVARYDVDGRLVRAFRIGGPGEDEAPAIAVHRDGDVVVTGTISLGTWSEAAMLGDTGVTLEPGFFIAKLAP